MDSKVFFQTMLFLRDSNVDTGSKGLMSHPVSAVTDGAARPLSGVREMEKNPRISQMEIPQ